MAADIDGTRATNYFDLIIHLSIYPYSEFDTVPCHR